ncbi:DUF2232 domain-containing protein [Romboutsia hominis]|uniref:DUF2232 domain-containing protein n=2 Tax=Romboutsia TaxID=1501226 RepID=UPI000B8839A2|nr:DUF2232 domain-containing protein [Romboutsia hominis]
MNETKKLTESAILSALFVISTLLFVGIGFGYALYIDFIVPVFFSIVVLRCDFKYSVLSGITSLLIVWLILGNIGIAIWCSQSVILGILCGYFISKDTSIMDDMVYTSFIGVVLMVFVDIYASKLIGYSFMKEFQGYINILKSGEYVQVIYYILIAAFPFGTVFSIYILSLFMCKKLNMLKGNINKKFEIIANFRRLSRFVCCSKNVFYVLSVYIFIVETFKAFNINIDNTYLKTIIISIEYLSFYFVIKDGYTAIQNYLLSKNKKVAHIRILSILMLIALVLIFKITTFIIIIINIILDIKINIRNQQIGILNNILSRG